eukprot:COSAG06_NODE_26015_length_623_cov_2.291985_1_plen_32_part_10
MHSATTRRHHQTTRMPELAAAAEAAWPDAAGD